MAERLLAEGKTGLLRIAYMSFAATELMPRAVSQYRKLNPDVAVNLRYIRTQGQKVALAQDEIDIGYMIGPFDHSEFHSVVLATDPLFVVMPQGHRLAARKSIRPADLADEALILGHDRMGGLSLAAQRHVRGGRHHHEHPPGGIQHAGAARAGCPALG